MSYGLLGVHVNSAIGGAPELLAAWKPPLAVVLDHSDVWHGVKAASPRTIFVGRLYQPQEPDFNRSDLDPLAAAREHCERVLPMADRMGETYRFWQGVNEPVPGSSEAMARYAAFEAERARTMHGHGFRVVVGSFSVGNPPELAWWKEFLPALEAARQFGGALALHEYAWPTLDRAWPWYLLRHRKVYDGEPRHGWAGLPAHLKRLPLLITECGLDSGIVPGHALRGWREASGSEQYLEQLAWYDAELQKDAYVKGAAIYCCGAAEGKWQSYDVWPEVARGLVQQAKPEYRSYSMIPPRPVRRRVAPVAAEPAPKKEVTPGTGETPPDGTTQAPTPVQKPAPRLGRAPHMALSIAGRAVDDGFERAVAPSAPTPDEDQRLEEILARLDRILEVLRKR